MTQLGTQPPESTKARKQPWRTLEEYSNDPEFLERVRQEFSVADEWWLDQPSRRAFLRTMGASFALAGLTGCEIRQPMEKIQPYVETPEEMIPGKAQFYATAVPQLGGAIGVLVESHEGRPTKIEGNPDHPVSRGATDSFTQASVLDLYDPHRSRVVRRNNRISDWRDFLAEVQPRMDIHRQKKGAGLALLTGEILSPTLQSQIRQLLSALPQMKWYQFEPAASEDVAKASQLAWNENLVPRYELSEADILFSVGDDFMGEGPARVRLAREFAARRKVEADGSAKMNRLYVLETTPSITGSKADHWLRLPPDQVAAILVGVAKKLGVELGAIPGLAQAEVQKHEKWIAALADDLEKARGRSAILVGPKQPAAIQALVHALNHELGNVGKTVTFAAPLGQIEGVQSGTLSDLTKEIDADNVETLFMLGVDPVYSAPADLDFAAHLDREKVPLAIHYGLHVDATSTLCEWHLPATHFLEEWSDTRSEDGTVSLVQPLIRPLYEGRSSHEVLNILLGENDLSGYNTVRNAWLEKFGKGNAGHWERALHDGLIPETAVEPKSVKFNSASLKSIVEELGASQEDDLEFTVVFQTDPCTFDGRYSTNGWLQELPKPFSKLTWGNAAWISPASAKQLGVKTRDVIEVTRGEATISVPVWVQSGMPEGVITLAIGHGRSVQGVEAVGVDVNSIRSVASPWRTTANARSSGQREVLPATQHHHLLEGRDHLRFGTLQQVQENPAHPAFVQGHHHHEEEELESAIPPGEAKHEHPDNQPDKHETVPGADLPTFYPDMKEEGPQWGMTVNLSACNGCNACVIACQSENNTPIVGADQVSRGREMQWLRIDSYFVGDEEAPEVYHQPVMCMHCEHAPCEPVCPVGATTHSDEGLNEMTYNRCIGTRYCSNNCPYKVRRFNFLDYHTEEKLLPVLQLRENPNVSVRSRGVMEKCTYCVQRINSVRINAKMEEREIRDGEVVTACQSACPAQAITFGNIADSQSAVTQEKKHPLNYGMLTELNTRPRTSYLAAVSNPNPALVSTEEHA